MFQILIIADIYESTATSLIHSPNYIFIIRYLKVNKTPRIYVSILRKIYFRYIYTMARIFNIGNIKGPFLKSGHLHNRWSPPALWTVIICIVLLQPLVVATGLSCFHRIYVYCKRITCPHRGYLIGLTNYAN